MNELFGQIPKPNPRAASDIVDAARHVESLLDDHVPEPDEQPPSEPFPRPGVATPDAEAGQEVIEDIDPFRHPASEAGEDEAYDGAVGGVVEAGIEYLAFYKSFRDVALAPAPNRWGIFFIKKRCVSLANDMSFNTGESFADCIDALAAFLYTHELYHYRFDAHCLQMEATGGFPVYRPYRRLVGGLPMTDWHEESIANFYGLKALQPNPSNSYPPSLCDYLHDLVENSPGAYAGGIDAQQRVRKDQMVQQALAATGHVGPTAWQALVGSIIRTGTSLSKLREPALSSRLSLKHCPVQWIDWVRGGKSILSPHAVSVAEAGGDFVERYLSGIVDRRTDHLYYRIDNGEVIKIPNSHRADLTYGEFDNIIGKAGMTGAQFWRERIRTQEWLYYVPRSPVLPSRFRSNRGGG